MVAHEKLDRAVLDAYGWPHETTDAEILARLLELNQGRAARGAIKSRLGGDSE